MLLRYTVQAGDNDGDGIASASPVVLNGGTIKDIAGNDAIVTFTPPDTTLVLVDTTAPTITSVAGPANGSYRAGQNLDFTANFSESVTVNTGGGTPTIGLTVGATARNAAYVSGSGSSSLLFRYTVQAGDNDSDGIASASPMVLNGGTIKDIAGNDATLTFSPPNTTAVLVDKIGRASSRERGPVNGGYGAWQNQDLTADFSENVKVNTGGGTPTIGLTIGATARIAAYGSGTGSRSQRCQYSVLAGDNDGDGIASASPIVLNGGTIKDIAGNDATLTFSPPNTTAVLVD